MPPTEQDQANKPVEQSQQPTEQVASALDHHPDRPISTVVTGGQVDQIINIARLDELKTTKLFYLFRDTKQVVVFLLILIAVASSISYIYWRSQQPEWMPEDGFNIAIAQIGQVTEKGVEATEDTTKFTIALSHYLSTQTGQDDFGLDVYVSNKKMPILMDEAGATKLAKKTNADLVVYGSVSFNRDIGEFLPSFYVVGRNGGIDATGYNQFARPITFTTEYNSKEQLKFILHTRASILTNFIKGLVYFNIKNPKYKAAEDSFQTAVNEAEKLPPFGGQEVLYLMLAAAQRQQATPAKFGQARSNLGTALDLNPEYARAGIGMGNSFYDEFVAGDADPMLLEQAMAEYSWALTAQDNPTSAHIDTKANIGLGNVLFLQARQGSDFTRLDDTRTYYQNAINAHLQNPEAIELARVVAYAYRGLGWIYDVQGNFIESKAAYEKCVSLPTDEKLRHDCQTELDAIKVTK